MKNSTKENWDISFCGLNCAKCDIYLASHGDKKLQTALLKWFQENIDPKIEYMRCERCRGPRQECWSNDCEMRSCAMKMNLDYCFKCSNFVCDKLMKFANNGPQHHKRTIENMRDMKKLGLKKWMSLQKESQFCP